MGGDSKKKKTKKKRVLAENTVGADDAPDAPKKPRTEVPPAAAAETATTLTKDQQTLADKWRERKENAKDGDVEAFALKPKKTEVQAVAYVTRVLDMTKSKGKSHIVALAGALDTANFKLRSGQQRFQINKALGDLSAVAFVAASEEREEEEGFVEGKIDVRLLTSKAKGGAWLRFDSAKIASGDDELGGLSARKISEALQKLSDPTDTYAQKWGFEVRYVTPEVRLATATNKVVRGYHRPRITPGTRATKAKDRLVADAERDEKERKAKVALAAAAKEEKEADRKAQYDMFGLTYFEAPPLPDGATEADLERLEDEDLEAMYGC